MDHRVRIIIEHVIDGKAIARKVFIDKDIKEITSISELGFNHQEQIDILKHCQSELLSAQSNMLKKNIPNNCPHCDSKLNSSGITYSHFHAIFTDHKIAVKRQRCTNKNCGWTSVPSIRSLFGSNMHPDLLKLHAEKSQSQSYRDAQLELNRLSYYPRKVNNHQRLYRNNQRKNQKIEISD